MGSVWLPLLLGSFPHCRPPQSDWAGRPSVCGSHPLAWSSAGTAWPRDAATGVVGRGAGAVCWSGWRTSRLWGGMSDGRTVRQAGGGRAGVGQATRRPDASPHPRRVCWSAALPGGRQTAAADAAGRPVGFRSLLRSPRGGQDLVGRTAGEAHEVAVPEAQCRLGGSEGTAGRPRYRPRTAFDRRWPEPAVR